MKQDAWKQEVWIQKQLKEIEGLQRLILAQQTRVEDTLETVKKESAVALKKISDLNSAADGFVSPELEQIINVVSVRAKTIDQKVSDTPCPE